ncbi:MAG TPA: hypothetical protein VE197_14860 [Mycobacterium sp.]|nr:hypothetical protein [Mycobacterium sp.]
MAPTANEQLIEAYFRMVKKDDYAGVGCILTDDATRTIVPIGHTWTGRRAKQEEAGAIVTADRDHQTVPLRRPDASRVFMPASLCATGVLAGLL